jgi:membrane protease YdiL (CAAX protease family)
MDEPEDQLPATAESAAVLDLQPPPPQPPNSVIHTIFLGPDGLRAGWRFVIYLASFFALLYALAWVTRPLIPAHPHQRPPVWVFLFGELESLVAAVVPALFLARMEKRAFGDYGLPFSQAFRKQFWLGMLWGIVAITVLLLVMRGVGVFYFGGLALHGPRVLKFAVFWAVLFLVVGLFEEFVTRGYSQFTLTRGIGFWPAAVFLSAIFGGIHLGNQGEAWIGALAAACIGLFFCLTLRRLKNLWFAIGLHASWDWGESFLYSVPDSGTMVPGHLMNPSFHGSRWLTGGTVGPEGSAFVFVVIAAMWVVFDRVYPAKTNSPDSHRDTEIVA